MILMADSHLHGQSLQSGEVFLLVCPQALALVSLAREVSGIRVTEATVVTEVECMVEAEVVTPTMCQVDRSRSLAQEPQAV